MNIDPEYLMFRVCTVQHVHMLKEHCIISIASTRYLRQTKSFIVTNNLFTWKHGGVCFDVYNFYGEPNYTNDS